MRFLAQAVRDSNGADYDLSCVLTLCALGLRSQEREEDLLMRLHYLLTEELKEDLTETAPQGAPEKGTPEDDQ